MTIENKIKKQGNIIKNNDLSCFRDKQLKSEANNKNNIYTETRHRQ